jgi:hypothetical protein
MVKGSVKIFTGAGTLPLLGSLISARSTSYWVLRLRSTSGTDNKVMVVSIVAMAVYNIFFQRR